VRQKFLVKGGSLEKLVERLTYHKQPDPEYLSAFLFTFRSFCTPKQLIDLLILRFDKPLPINCLEEERKKFDSFIDLCFLFAEGIQSHGYLSAP